MRNEHKLTNLNSRIKSFVDLSMLENGGDLGFVGELEPPPRQLLLDGDASNEKPPPIEEQLNSCSKIELTTRRIKRRSGVACNEEARSPGNDENAYDGEDTQNTWAESVDQQVRKRLTAEHPEVPAHAFKRIAGEARAITYEEVVEEEDVNTGVKKKTSKLHFGISRWQPREGNHSKDGVAKKMKTKPRKRKRVKESKNVDPLKHQLGSDEDEKIGPEKEEEYDDL